jgi:hypothetical protein
MRTHKIVIPSYKRSQYLMESEQCAFHNIPTSEMKNVFLLVRKSEEEDYKKVLKRWPCNIATIPDERIVEGHGIRSTRAFLMEHFLDKCDVLITIDDDIRIGERNPDKGRGFYRKVRDLDSFFPVFLEKMKSVDADCPLASVLQRLFCNMNGQKAGPLINYDAIQVLAYDTAFFREHPEFNYEDGPKYMSDYFFNTKVAVAGYGVMVFTDFIKQDCQDGTRVSGSGGCAADGRTLKDTDICAMTLAKTYPEYITPYVKIRPSSWGDEPTIGLKFSWSKLIKCYKGARYADRTAD